MHTMRGEVQAGRREGRGNGGARSVQGWDRLQIGGAGHGEERTENMQLVVVKSVGRKQRAGGGSDQRLRARHACGAHPEHLAHVLDA